ncbi:MAG: neutral/alkaline non-lysosomal ceramidase N-terminal domain-containing protein [Chitinophagales bacterium]
MLLGRGKADITAFVEGVGMLGYGMYYNIMQQVETPLFARAFVFKTDSRKIAYVNCELAFITPSLKRGVIKKLTRKYPDLGYENQNLLITAQHTHSGPGGYSHHGLYNMNSPGFVIEIYKKIVDGIVEAILKAEENFEDVDLELSKGEFAPDKEVGFQRSLHAYLQNPEAKQITKKDLHLGIDREMTMLRFVNKSKNILASINWFGTHPTSLPNTNTRVCSDNKGYATQYLEEDLGKENPNFIAAFSQGSCGDVSPKFIYNKKFNRQRGKYQGKYADDLESAKYNGKLQYEKAKELLETTATTEFSGNEVDYTLRYVDFSNIQVNPKFTGGKENVRTSLSCMGVSFMEGAIMDGPGLLQPLSFVARRISNLIKLSDYLRAPFMPKEWGVAMRQKYASQGNKHVMIESGARRIMGTYNVSKMILPSFIDETIANLKEFHKRGALDGHPWTPQILPLQIVQINGIALCAFPFEITTIAAQRLKKSLEDVLLKHPQIKEVILSPYSNAYNGYVTTFEEYQVQCYEGGHTVFGEYTLAALQTEFEKLAEEMLKPYEQRSTNHEILPLVFTKEDLEKFEHFKGNYYQNSLRRKEKLAKLNAKRREKLEKRKMRIQSRIDKLS